MKIRRTPLGCLSLTAILGMLVVLLVVVGFSLLRGGWLFSPGGLNAQPLVLPTQPATGVAQPLIIGGVTTHAQIADCAICHTPIWSRERMADACEACHIDLVQNPKNFHKALFAQGQSQDCRTCHTEHHGAGGVLTLVSLTNFPHDSTGYSLIGHKTIKTGIPFKCSDCHQNYVVFDQALCATCHQKLDEPFTAAHLAAYGPVRTACHDGVDSYGHAFDHHKVPFDLVGRYASLACAQCHQGAQRIADFKNISTTCYACHAKKDAHQGQFGQDCAACHSATGWRPASFDHATTTFPLAGSHAQVDCQACHTSGVFKGTPTAHYACHAKKDAHLGKFGRDCGLCHTPTAWSPSTFDHPKSTFPLIGKHQTASCQSCHTANVFKGTPIDCFSCHAKNDAHKGQLGQNCGECHSATGWVPSTFDHSKTSFQLTGSHLKVDCTKCHQKDTSGTITFKGAAAQCAGCHADPNFHKGLFGADCAKCHTTKGWLPASFNGPHAFPINHGRAGNCQACHPQALSNYNCFTCHNQADTTARHLDSGISNISNCVQCHANGRNEGGGG